MEFEFYQLTSAGDRESNQDYMAYIINDTYALLVVADGLGGYSAGDKASRFFCQGLLATADYSKRMQENPVATFAAWLDAAIDKMKLLFQDDEVASKAHTTCVCLFIDSHRVLTAHCGDSRIYRMNPKEILWRSQDHSIPQQLLNAGKISEEEMGVHPDQNQLTRSINVLKKHHPEIHEYPAIQKGETFLLCTDGFWGNVKQTELLQLAQPASGKAALGKVAQLTVLRALGRSDNVTVQWLRCL
ncbi:MAG: serine/threonine-protein phosphatase [Methylococcales bacterium]|nr:serine/threonine-protein phosphatase [Methylococcales bacterium]